MLRGPLPLDCFGCPLAGADGHPKHPVVGIGAEKPKFLVLGEGPGGQEVARSQPFVGPSGALLNNALKAWGVNREEVYITNTTLCRPPFGQKEKLVEKAAQCCRERLDRELNQFPGVPLLALGKHAAQVFLGDKFKITELAGSFHEVNGRQIVPTIHPAAILRGGAGEDKGNGQEAHATDLLYWNLQYDVRKMVKLAEGKQTSFVDNIDIEFQDRGKADDLVTSVAREIREAGRFGCDTETVGVEAGDCTRCPNCRGHSALQPLYARLTAIGLATDRRSVSVAWNCLTARGKDVLQRLFSDENLEVVFHNRNYDEVVIAQHGLPIRNKIHCTLLMHHNAFPGLSHRLQRVTTQFFLVQPWKAEYRYGADTVENLLKYNARDTLACIRLRVPLRACIDGTNSDKTYEMDLKMAEVAAKMHVWGIPIDPAANAALRDHFVPYISSKEMALAGRLDDGVKGRFFQLLATEQARRKRKDDSEDFMERHATRMEELVEEFESAVNFKSSDQVVAFLKACGVPLTAVTKTGKTSTRKEILEALGGNPVIRDLLDYRTASKLYDTFVQPIPFLVDNASRIHPVWGVHMITGRWNSRPNFQNFSKGDKKKGVPNLRKQVVAPEGRMLVGADMKQLEAREIGLFSGEPYLMKAFNDGLDIHSEFAKEAFPEFASLDLESEERKLKRDHTKTMEYGYLYRAMPQTVWKQSFIKKGHLDVPLRRVAEMFEIFRKRMPRVEDWHAEKFRRVMKEGKLSSFLYGRTRWFPLGLADATVVANFDVQAGAADIMNTGVWRFYSRLPDGVKILIQGHDSLVVECDEDHAEKVRDLLVDSMTQQYEYEGRTMLFPVDSKIGKSWSEV